ncbi:MAG TPA: VanW family protein [Patescibacteria group bacterium]
MILNLLFALGLFASVTANQPQPSATVLGGQAFSLEKRYSNTFVNDVFKDNILLTLFYMRGMKMTSKPDWNAVEAPFTYSFILKPGEVFAFHEDVLPEFEGKVVKTTNSQFGADEGFKSDGYLVADGVCHLASLINEAAQNAGLKVVAPTNHNFAVIPEIDKKYGTAIYFMPGSKSANSMQNLYVENNKDVPVEIVFEYKNNELTVNVEEVTNL